MGQGDYIFWPVESIIRSLSFDVFKSSLYNYVWRVGYGDLDIKAFFYGYNISTYCVSYKKEARMKPDSHEERT